MTIRLLIVDDHATVREGLRMTFDATDVLVVAEAASGLEALEQLRAQPVDVVLLDIQMPFADGFQFLAELRAAGDVVPVLMHSVYEGPHFVRRSRELGAQGLLRKGHEKETLLAAIHAVHAGQQVWEPGAT